MLRRVLKMLSSKAENRTADYIAGDKNTRELPAVQALTVTKSKKFKKIIRKGMLMLTYLKRQVDIIIF